MRRPLHTASAAAFPLRARTARRHARCPASACFRLETMCFRLKQIVSNVRCVGRVHPGRATRGEASAERPGAEGTIVDAPAVACDKPRVQAALTGIGPYRITRMLAAEDEQTLFLGHPEGDPGRRVTIAVQHAALAADPALAKAFELRAKVALRLRDRPDPVVASGRDAGVAVSASGARPWAVWDPLDGASLEQLMAGRKRFRMAIGPATNLLIALLDALATAARARVVHGKLRASDVWVTPEGWVKVCNFGADDDPRADFLAVARIAQELGTEWVPEVDAWIDALQREEPPWKNADEARRAFPLTATETGKAALQKASRAAVRKLLPASSLDEEGPPAQAPPASRAHESGVRAARGPRGDGKAAALEARRERARRESVRAARQARRVAIICALCLSVAILVEVCR
jgi:hypothetical protein